MKNILNMTNGDCAVKIMKEANIVGEFLPWQDILHEGPVLPTLTLEGQSIVRAGFIAERGWGEESVVKQSFIERNNKLKSFEQYDKVILWFEHDLYDQLQLLQILDWFYVQPPHKVELSIICTDNYLGLLSAVEMAELVKYEEAITEKHLALAHKAWAAFLSNTPANWYGLLQTDTSVLPFLEGAVIRMLEEYPSYKNGLSRTANQALNILLEGEIGAGELFSRYQETEERQFLGDLCFWYVLERLSNWGEPLLSCSNGERVVLPMNPKQKLVITPLGKEVLAGKRNWLDMVEIGQWIGGVCVITGSLWCWDANAHSLKKIKSKGI